MTERGEDPQLDAAMDRSKSTHTREDHVRDLRVRELLSQLALEEYLGRPE